MPIRLPKQTVENWLKQCLASQAFVSIDGQRVTSIKDMVKMIQKMSEQSYEYHVNKRKNDLAAWVEGVFHDGHLAANFRSARSKKEAYQYCKRHYLMLERNLRDANIRDEKRKRRLSLRKY
jgi:hypothetical protein